MKMKRITILAAAIILAGVAAVKLYLPGAAPAAGDSTVSALFPHDAEVMSKLLSDKDEPVPASGKYRVKEVEICPVAQEVPKAVSVFLAEQSKYADLDLPATATFDYIAPPDGYVLPVAGYGSSGYGFRLHPIDNEVSFHYGTDIAAWTGDSVRCFLPGEVTTADYDDVYGNYIVVTHDDGWESLYAHCSELLVQPGHEVSAGDKIAVVGATGYVTGPHLHFELKHNGINVNPEYYINSL